MSVEEIASVFIFIVINVDEDVATCHILFFTISGAFGYIGIDAHAPFLVFPETLPYVQCFRPATSAREGFFKVPDWSFRGFLGNHINGTESRFTVRGRTIG